MVGIREFQPEPKNVEAVSLAIYEVHCSPYQAKPDWSSEPAEIKQLYRAMARAAMSAYEQATPPSKRRLVKWPTEDKLTADIAELDKPDGVIIVPDDWSVQEYISVVQTERRRRAPVGSGRNLADAHSKNPPEAEHEA